MRFRLMMPVAFLLLVVLCAATTSAQTEKIPAEDQKSFLSMAEPTKPYRIIGNVYSVGAKELTSFLITTPHGHILIDTGLEEMAPQILKNMETLGFHAADIKILLNTQAHIDHAAGFATLKRISGAKLMVSEADAPVIESGGAKDFLWADRYLWEPAKVDEFVKDEEVIELGGVRLTAHLTPGHTKGCTSYTLTVKEEAKEYHIVFLGSITRVGAKLVDNAKYPQIADDYEHTFQLLRSLPCDVFLASHASFYGALEKAKQLQRGEKPNPFIDPQSYRDFLNRQENGFHEELAKEKAANRS